MNKREVGQEKLWAMLEISAFLRKSLSGMGDGIADKELQNARKQLDLFSRNIEKVHKAFKKHNENNH